MSDFKAKNLTYDKTQPAFLQRLKAEYAGDRNNVQFARPNKSRLKTGDAEEDEPTIVDGSGEGVSKEEYEDMLKIEKGVDAKGVEDEQEEEKSTTKDSQEEGGREEARDKQNVAQVGVGKKRKAVKVVRDDNYVDDASRAAKESKHSDDKKGVVSELVPKPKRKTKKIKLSFDEPGD